MASEHCMKCSRKMMRRLQLWTFAKYQAGWPIKGRGMRGARSKLELPSRLASLLPGPLSSSLEADGFSTLAEVAALTVSEVLEISGGSVSCEDANGIVSCACLLQVLCLSEQVAKSSPDDATSKAKLA